MAKKKAARQASSDLLANDEPFRKIDENLPSKKSYHYEGWLTLRTPLMHGGDTSLGTTRLFRSQKTVCTDGKVRKLPIYSGNALRGVFRDIAAEQLLKSLNVAVPAPVFDFLTSGGSLTSKGPSIDVGLGRRLRGAVPMVALFGGGVGNQILEGKLIFLQGTPICKETIGLLPAYCQDAPSANLSIRDLRQIEFGTRRDDKKKESILPMLDGDPPEKKEGDVATQMKYETETLAPGSCLRFGFIANDVTESEWTAFCNILVAWLRKPFLGGRASAGYGEVNVPLLYRAERVARLSNGSQIDKDSPLATVEDVIHSDGQLSLLADEIESIYASDVDSRRNEIIDALSEVV